MTSSTASRLVAAKLKRSARGTTPHLASTLGVSGVRGRPVFITLTGLISVVTVSLLGASIELPDARTNIVASSIYAIVLLTLVAAGLRNARYLTLIGAFGLFLIDPSALLASDTLLRYVPIVVLIVTSVVIAHGNIGLEKGRIVLGAFAILGVGGALAGRFILGVQDGVLPMMIPALLALPSPKPTVLRTEAIDGPGLRFIGLSAAFATFYAALARLGVPGFDILTVNHEQAYLSVLGIAIGYALRSRLILLVNAGCTVLVFAAYPAATYAVALLCWPASVLLLHLLRTRLIRVLVGVTVACALASIGIFSDFILRLAAPYFALVGKIDNGDTREQILNAAFHRVGNPVWGSFFSGSVTVPGILSGRVVTVPVHNDYLTVFLAGGLIGLLLLVSAVVYTNGSAAVAWWAGGRQERLIVGALLGAFNAAVISSLANPVLMKPSSAALVFSLAGVLLTFGAEQQPAKTRAKRSWIRLQRPAVGVSR